MSSPNEMADDDENHLSSSSSMRLWQLENESVPSSTSATAATDERNESFTSQSHAERWAAAAAASAEQDQQDEQESFSSSASAASPRRGYRGGLEESDSASLYSSSSSHRGGGPAGRRSKIQSNKMKRKGLAALEAAALGGAGGSSGSTRGRGASTSARAGANRRSLATNIRDMERQHGVGMGTGTGGGGEDSSVASSSTDQQSLEQMHNKRASLELHELAEGDALKKSSKAKGVTSPSSAGGGGGAGGLGGGPASPEEVRNRANFLLGLDTSRGSLDSNSRQQLMLGSLPDRHVLFGGNQQGQDGENLGSRAASLARAAGRASAKLSHKLRRDINNFNQQSENDSHSTYFDDEYSFGPSASRLRNSRFNMADEELGIDIAQTRSRFKRSKLAVAATLLTAAVVAFAYNAFWGGGGDGTPPDSSSSGVGDLIATPQGAEQKVRLYEIRQRIRDSGMKNFGDIDCLATKWSNRPPTPQCQAVNWLALKDPMKVDPRDEFLLQRYALACFWFATFGLAEQTDGHDDAELHYWTEHAGWMTGAGICSWAGIICHHQPGTDPKDNIRTYDANNLVTHLRLPDNSIRGTMPGEVFYHLTGIRQIDLSGNSLTGSISDDIGRLKFLQYLYLYNNVLTGSIPSSIGDSIDVREIDISDNALSSTLPESFGQLRSLSLLALFDNQLSGTVPTDLGSLGLLEVLYLDNNKFEGTIPESLLNLPKLYDFRINKNFLTGQIPETKKAGVLELLYLDSNKLTGFIPPSLSRHERLASLRLFSNGLIGAIPSELSALTSLDHLSLEFNQLQGTIPHELLVSLTHLSEFYLQGNAELSGTIPSQIGELTDLKEFRAHDCSLTGSIPSEIGQLYRLEALDVSNNKLSSSLPDLSQLERLTHLKIGGNVITGVVSNDNCELTKVSLAEFSADCAGSSPDIVCACCTECL